MLVHFINGFHPPQPQFKQEWRTVHVDGFSSRHGSGAGVILERPNGIALAQSLCFRFKASCNQEKYKALSIGLRLAREVSAQRVKC